MLYHPWPLEPAAALTKTLKVSGSGVRTTVAVTLLNASLRFREWTIKKIAGGPSS
jgi:hypothetical protein